MSGGWVPMPADVWPMVRPPSEPRWHQDLAAFDLRWEYDQTGKLPSRTKLGERWGWTRDEVRTLLRHPERWWDPKKGDLPTSRDDLTQRDPSRPKLTQADPTPTDEPGHTNGIDPSRPKLTQADPTVPQRVDPPSPSPPPSQEEEQLPKPPARRKSGKASGEAKPKRFDDAWLKLLSDRWVSAWGASPYRFDWFKDRETLARCIAALDVPRNHPAPPEALDHLERAMSAYIAAARRDDPKCFPKGTPTVSGFVFKLADWLHSTETTLVTNDVPKASIEARVRQRIQAGASIPEVRDEVRKSTRLKGPEQAYAMTVLDRLEAR